MCAHIYNVIYYRFGKCEQYKGYRDVCNGIFTVDVDYVFVLTNLGTQESISDLLILATHQLKSSNCHDNILRVICNYYLIPCGTNSSLVPPYSICPENCSAVQMECPEAWKEAQEQLEDHQFISCEDTSALLFPLPSCCTGVGLQHSMPEEGDCIVYILPTMTMMNIVFICLDPKGNNGGRIAGAVVGSVVAVGVIILTVVLIYLFFTWRNRQKVKNLQMDIFARYVSMPICIQCYLITDSLICPPDLGT